MTNTTVDCGAQYHLYGVYSNAVGNLEAAHAWWRRA